MNTKNIVAISIITIAVLGYWFWSSPTSHPLPIVSGDKIESWNFQGSHRDGGVNEEKAHDEITRLEGMLADAETEPTDYALYVSIANQYVLLGDGKATYTALGKALEIDSDKTGLAWHNLGDLMERLGAYGTARIAFGKSVEAQPIIEAYHIANFRFILKHFSNEAVVVEKAIKSAESNLGKEDTVVLQLWEEWLIKQGKIDEAAEIRKQLQIQLGAESGNKTVKTVE